MRPVAMTSLATALSLSATSLLAQASSGPAMQSVLDFMEQSGSDLEVSWDEYSNQDGVELYKGVVMKDASSQLDIAGLVLKDRGNGMLSVQGQYLSTVDGDATIEAKKLLMTVSPENMAEMSKLTEDLTVTDFCETFGEQAAFGLFELKASNAESKDYMVIDAIEAKAGSSEIAGSCVADLSFSLSGMTFHVDGSRGNIGEISLESFAPLSYMMPSEKTGLEFKTEYSLKSMNIDSADGSKFFVKEISASGDSNADSMVALAKTSLMDAIKKVEEAEGNGQPVGDDVFANVDFVEVWNASIEAIGASRIVIDGLDITAGPSMPLPPTLGDTLNLDVVLELDKAQELIQVTLEKDLANFVAASVGLKLKMGEFDTGVSFDDPMMALTQLPLYFVSANFMFDDKGLDEALKGAMGMGITDGVDMAGLPIAPGNTELVKNWINSSLGDAPAAKVMVQPPAPLPVTALVPMLMGDWSVLGENLGVN